LTNGSTIRELPLSRTLLLASSSPVDCSRSTTAW
jgi:hypothetical protein